MSSQDSLWEFHVDVRLDRNLWIVCHNKVNLAESPSKNDSEDDHKPDSKPCHNICVHLKIVHSVDLLSAMEDQPSLVRLYLVSCEIAYAPYVPYGVIRNLISFLDSPIAGILMSINFLDHSLDKFLHIWLPERLLKINDVTHHLGVECNRVLHALL